MSASWKVFVYSKPRFPDHRGDSIRKECAAAGLKGVRGVRAGQAYELAGASEEDARRLTESLLADPVTQQALLVGSDGGEASGAVRAQVWPRTGVADPVADTVRLAAQDVGVRGLSAVRSGQVYDFAGRPKEADVKRFCEERLMNALIQRVEVS